MKTVRLSLLLVCLTLLIILHSPYSKDALEVFVGLSIVGYNRNFSDIYHIVCIKSPTLTVDNFNDIIIG